MRNTQQLLRWSGTVLSPRTRPYSKICPSMKHYSSQATAEAIAPVASPSTHDPEPQPLRSPRSRKILSPLPEKSRKSARLAALHARLYLSPRIPLETLGRCLVDVSADSNPSFNNSSLSLLGHDILNYHASELILCRYPRLPSAIILASMTALIGPAALTDLSKSWGIQAVAAPGAEVDPGLLQFTKVRPGNSETFWGSGILLKEQLKEQKTSDHGRRERGVSATMRQDDYFGEITGREVLTPLKRDGNPAELQSAKLGSTYQGASTHFVRALFGAIYIHSGRLAAKNFFAAHIASRKLDVSKLFIFKQPERDLAKLCAREGFEAPVARMISESGRLSIAPVYNVGVFSGKEKLGEAIGASLQEARFRAAVSALKGWYLYSPVEVKVPSDVEGGGNKEWTPVLIDGGEVVY